MRYDAARNGKPLILLLVLLLHCGLIDVLIRESKLGRVAKTEAAERLLVFFLPRDAPSTAAVKNDSTDRPPRRDNRLTKSTRPKNVAPTEATAPSTEAAPPPAVDWQHELELAAQSGITEAEKQKNYRDLSASLSPAQLNWLEQNHMQPAHPGMTWKKPRLEITAEGLPIVHVNDHCVLLPLLIVPMVFCGIGHVEANGDLFEHMRDPQP